MPKKGTRPGTPRAKLDAIAERRRQVSRLRRDGAMMPEIAKALGVTTMTIFNDMKFVLKEWRGERIENTDQIIDRELLKLDRSEIEARSMFNDEVKRAKAEREVPVFAADGKTVVGYHGREPSTRWFDRVMAIRESRRKLLGLDGPAKVEHSVKLEDLRQQAEKYAAELGVPAEEIMETAIQLANEVH